LAWRITTNRRITAFILPKWHNIRSTADISYCLVIFKAKLSMSSKTMALTAWSW